MISYEFYWIRSLMLMRATKFSKHSCYFLTFFCRADNPVAHYLILLHAKRTGVVPGKQKISVSHRAVCRQLKAQRIVRLLILTRFPCSEKGNTLFTDPKNRQVKIKWFLVAQKSSSFFQVHVQFNLRLRGIIFVTDVAVLTSETTKLVFKPLDIFWRFWNTRKR